MEQQEFFKKFREHMNQYCEEMECPEREDCDGTVKVDSVSVRTMACELYHFADWYYERGWVDKPEIEPFVAEQMLDILEHFCWKVESGRAQSRQTYRQARRILNKIKGEGYVPKKIFERRER